MVSRSGTAALVAAAMGVLAGSMAHSQAAEGGFLEMLFGAAPASRQIEPRAPAAERASAYRRQRVGSARHILRTRYAALPVKIRLSERQTPIDMTRGAAAAFLKDETLRPGDIVILNTGPRVFTGSSGKRHAMSDFEPVHRSASVSRSTRKLLAGLMTPVGALPADEARRMTARLRKAPPAATPITPVASRSAEMRVISPWRTAP